MLRAIELDDKGIEILKVIMKEIKNRGSSRLCPAWNVHINKENFEKVQLYSNKMSTEKCQCCEALFPRVMKEKDCPCKISYNPKFLINRIKEIIKFNEK